ncbi:MAG: type II secretion system protein [Blastocatellia bacterium]|nr:type II secretion system protein [Blastocatellia bacterium]
MKTLVNIRPNERGMTLFALLAAMAIFAVALLAVAPTIQIEVQRTRELESIRRGEEVADAIRQYIEHHRGTKLPTSMDDLLDGLPNGTKKRQILRASSATDPLSVDGKWRLIQVDVKALGLFAKRIQDYTNGLLPSNNSQLFDRYALVIVNSINYESESDATAPDDFEVTTENVPFIGVASQSTTTSVLTYYGIENHSKWIFTPLFRGAGANPMSTGARPPRPGGAGSGVTFDR